MLRILLLSVSVFYFVTSRATPLDEHIEITHKQPRYHNTLSKLFQQQSMLDDSSYSPDSIAAMLAQSGTVNLNGQGGLFQTINIRGFARWRIQSLVEGIPIHTDRRAGAALEFLPPSFVAQAYLTQGAASVQLGSGADWRWGRYGARDACKAWPLQYDYGHLADARQIQIEGQTKKHRVSWLFNHRHGNETKSAHGEPIQSRYEQHSFMVRKKHGLKGLNDALLLYSSAQ